MIKKHIYIAALGLAALAAGCSEERFDASGEGSLSLSASLKGDMELVSRADDQALAESCRILISNEKGLVRRYIGLGQVPASIDLVTGRYVAEGMAGDSVSASWDKRWFKGREEFDIKAGETTPVKLECAIANVAASVNYSEGLEEVLADFTMTIGHDRGSLIFEGREERTGYFMMPSTSKDLTYTLKGTQINGEPFELEGTIEDARPATEYQLNVTYTKQTTELGGLVFSIKIDRTEKVVTDEIMLVAAPAITGYGFDIAGTVTGEPGGIGRQTVYITSATKISSVLLKSDVLKEAPVLGGDDCSLLAMSEVGVEALNALGINFVNNYNEENNSTIFQLNFEDTLLDNLEQGDYTFAITATDDQNHTSSATLSISVTDAPVITLDPLPEDITNTTAIVRGVVAKDGAEKLGFYFWPEGSAEKTYVEGTVIPSRYAANTEFFAEVTGLKGNTTYEYVTAADDFVSTVVCRFTTLNDQLPNCGFEEWSDHSDGSEMPSSDPNVIFWDSGNHGSRTMSKNITTKETSIKHSGNSAICLKSQFVGVGTLGKFAAGNVFAGKYLKTDGTDGVLGWGRPWTFSPKMVKLWAKYVPKAAVNKKGAGDRLPVGEMDKGIIYVALTTDATSSYEGTEWSCVVKTKTSELFNKNGDNVIAYGEYVFETATEGDEDGNGMVQIEIPIEYYKPGVKPSNIIFVCSASMYGDYFQGGDGSLLYIDDIELVY